MEGFSATWLCAMNNMRRGLMQDEVARQRTAATSIRGDRDSRDGVQLRQLANLLGDNAPRRSSPRIARDSTAKYWAR